jgi:hypothetical protein
MMSILDFNFDFSGVTGSGFNTVGSSNMTYDLYSGFGSNASLSGIDTSAYTLSSPYNFGSYDYSLFSGLDTSSGFNWANTLNSASSIVKSVAGVAGSAFTTLTSGMNAAAPYLQLASAITAAGAQKTAAIYQQGLYEVQAVDTLRLAQIRTDQDQKYAAIQAGRKLLSAERQALNYTIQGNSLLRGMERSNAAVRARAAANGIVYNEGSAAGVQLANVSAIYRDVGMSNLNALTARILGFEDAGAMILASKEQADLTMSAAEAQASQMRLAGQYAVASGGVLSNATLLQGGLNFTQTVRNPFTS